MKTAKYIIYPTKKGISMDTIFVNDIKVEHVTGTCSDTAFEMSLRTYNTIEKLKKGETLTINFILREHGDN